MQCKSVCERFAFLLIFKILALEPTHLVKKGGYAELTCEVTGTPEIKITWFKDDRELKESDKYNISFTKSLAILRVSEVDTEDSGEYICEAKNDAGKDTCSSVVTRKQPPSFARKLKDLEHPAGLPLKLMCRLNGSEPITVTWHKDGVQLKDDHTMHTSFVDNVAVLQLVRTEMSHTGQYSCTATNSVGTATSSARLTVCEIAGTPPFEVAWFKDRRQVRSSKKFKVTAKHSVASLHILNLESQDTGEYQCKAMNEVGSDTCTCPVKFKVTKLSDTAIFIGEPTALQAVVEGSSPISVVWLKDKGEVIRESENIQMWFMDNIATLEIASAEGTDVGKYICQIKNDAGMRECSAFLQVLGGYSLLHIGAVSHSLHNWLSQPLYSACTLCSPICG
uniref:Ig-like domain-containing protein n=1 Tax=Malurus cyaneus samueli TaxID=2593467 RepID=A0A8C5TWL3_9PASS